MKRFSSLVAVMIVLMLVLRVPPGPLLRPAIRLVIASIVCGAVAGGAAWLIAPEFRLIRGIVPVAAGILAYFVAAWIIRVPEARALLDRLRNRP